MHSKYIVRGISVFAFGAYCYLFKKDWDELKDKSIKIQSIKENKYVK
jgi:hypothetical protein